MKRPDLLLLIAIWEFITAFGALIGITAIAVLVFPEIIHPFIGPAMPGAIFGLSIAILVLLCYISLALAGGIGLLQGKDWGRILSIAHAALTLFWFPIGTVIGILSIIYLARPEVTDYMNAISDN
ncbi:MAG: hypothetical protein JSV32_02815 [Dehalococcoidia bacterium]|nr:MAG: hypothetical protein JSV32_02815 [Dehalococcoidia bacterium]